MADQPSDIAAELRRLADATDDLVRTIVTPVARGEATRVVRIAEEASRLRRAEQLWQLVAGMTAAIMLSVALVDMHVHRSHIAPLEHGRPTSGSWPMWPNEYTEGIPVGPVLLFLGVVLIVLSLANWQRARRRREEQEQRVLGEFGRSLVETMHPPDP